MFNALLPCCFIMSMALTLLVFVAMFVTTSKSPGEALYLVMYMTRSLPLLMAMVMTSVVAGLALVFRKRIFS